MILEDPCEIEDLLVQQHKNGELKFIENRDIDYTDHFDEYSKFIKLINAEFKEKQFGLSVCQEHRVVFNIREIASAEDCRQQAESLVATFME